MRLVLQTNNSAELWKNGLRQNHFNYYRDKTERKKQAVSLTLVLTLVICVHLLIVAALLAYSSKPLVEPKNNLPIMVQLVSAGDVGTSSAQFMQKKSEAAVPPVKTNTPVPIEKNVVAPVVQKLVKKPVITKSIDPSALAHSAATAVPVETKSAAAASSSSTNNATASTSTNTGNAGTDQSEKSQSNAAAKEQSDKPVSLGENGIGYINKPDPEYPEISKENGEEGVTKILIEVDENGKLVKAVVKSSSGSAALDKAALSAVKKTRFKPYVQNGEGRRAQAIIPIEFNLRNS